MITIKHINKKKLMMMEKQVMMKKQMEMFQMKQNMMKQAQVNLDPLDPELFSGSVIIGFGSGFEKTRRKKHDELSNILFILFFNCWSFHFK